MTENKRFTLTERQCYFTSLIFDSQKNEKMGSDEAMECLNALHEENKKLKQINSNLGDFRNFITEQNVLNEKQRKELQLQMLRLYNYFENYFEDTMSPNAFSEMWDNVKDDEKWD